MINHVNYHYKREDKKLFNKCILTLLFYQTECNIILHHGVINVRITFNMWDTNHTETEDLLVQTLQLTHWTAELYLLPVR